MDYDIIKRYEAINKIFKEDVKKGIKGEDMADLTTELLKLCTEKEYFLKDIVTGNIKTTLNASGSDIISEADARTIFYTRFMDKMRLKTYRLSGGEMESSWVKVNKQQTDVLFSSIMMYCTYNSRREYYESIPEWDGINRIDVFMEKYFKCTTSPKFFWLLMVGIVGKIADPMNCYVPYWFDFIGEKGIGKSRFFERLMDGKYIAHMHEKSRMDDLFVELYMANAAVAIDDEGGMVGGKYSQMSYDQWKEFITAVRDTFSRKFCQPETHYRSFVTVRTSNESKTVFSMSERRQVIFECKNKPNECYINDLPQEFFTQLLAQAKAYYEANGMYKLDDDSRTAIQRQNIKYFNNDTEECNWVMQFITEMITFPNSSYFEKVRKPGMYVSLNTFCRWLKDNYPSKSIKDKALWKSVDSIYHKTCTIYYDKYKTKLRPQFGNNPVSMFKILEAKERVELEEKRRAEGLIIDEEDNDDTED
ncbi:MAG: virulence-associated E family protein [Bacteroidaceae bacterium]|nr:virulence-associated E family protein [Bacteroidaceae bacterium]